MVVPSFRRRAASRAACLLLLVAGLAGCQAGQQVSSRQLIEHQAFIDFAGLKQDALQPAVKTTIATPRNWEQMPRQSTPLYTHEQWRAPSAHTGIGVLYAHMPLPLSAKAVIWLAKQEYSKSERQGRVIGEWTDSLGRYWFEAENEKYHVRGYAVVKGFDAWFVYFGYRTKYAMNVPEISLAARSAETAVPMVDSPATSAPATQPSRGEATEASNE